MQQHFNAWAHTHFPLFTAQNRVDGKNQQWTKTMLSLIEQLMNRLMSWMNPLVWHQWIRAKDSQKLINSFAEWLWRQVQRFRRNVLSLEFRVSLCDYRVPILSVNNSQRQKPCSCTFDDTSAYIPHLWLHLRSTCLQHQLE
jgi:hypothetical protein